ncbi:MAG: thiol-disulfide oxidoreductase DCC family protein [Bacteroidia bacterium]|nr:thiol-disulfide oxidoreductase DCC family protein [Bacteroidia bacterium]
MNDLNSKGVVLFDGVCNFCNSSVNFIIRHDKKDFFRFTPLQSEIGIKISEKYNLDSGNLKSVILVEKGRIYTKTTAALRIAKQLSGGWPLLYAFIIVPAPIRDVVYNIIAKYRYKWWGERESCMIPTPEIRKKFL